VDYDALRATLPRSNQAVDKIDALPALAAIEIDWVKLATTTFNAEGHEKATAACAALMKAMPDVDWAALARADAAVIAEVGSLKPSLWQWISSL